MALTDGLIPAMEERSILLLLYLIYIILFILLFWWEHMYKREFTRDGCIINNVSNIILYSWLQGLAYNICQQVNGAIPKASDAMSGELWELK